MTCLTPLGSPLFAWRVPRGRPADALRYRVAASRALVHRPISFLPLLTSLPVAAYVTMGNRVVDHSPGLRIELRCIMEPSPPPAHAPAPDVPGFRPLGVTHLVGRAGPPDWLWDGYLAAGHLTLLTSPWKSGKTTLAAVLVARMATGVTFAGGRLKPGTVVVLPDESTSPWAGRHARLNFGPNVGLLCRPFRGRPT